MLITLACTGDDPAPKPADTDTGTTSDGNVHDALSMPEVPTLDPASFNPAVSCQTCHPEHYGEWRMSMHAYAMVDPVFQALTSVRQVDLAGTEDQFCLQCHSAIGTRGGEIVAGFSYDELSDITMEGITCEACHKVSEIARDYNSGHVLDPDGPIRGPFSDPMDNPFHESEPAPDLFTNSEFCGACHDAIETSGLDLERPYREWQESPAAEEGQVCQDCHMPTIQRPSAWNGPERPSRDHRFIGVDYPLIDGWVSPDEEAEIKASIEALLATAADLTLDAPAEVSYGQMFDVTVTVNNKIGAHNLPTGSTFLRQVWVELTATDGEGNVLYATGDLDANGDLRDYWSELEPYGDPDLMSLSSGFVDASGNPVLFPWAASEHNSNTISPLYDRTWTLFIPTDQVMTPPVTIDATLHFRTIAPFLLEALGLPQLIGKVEVHDLAADTIQVGIAP